MPAGQVPCPGRGEPSDTWPLRASGQPARPLPAVSQAQEPLTHHQAAWDRLLPVLPHTGCVMVRDRKLLVEDGQVPEIGQAGWVAPRGAVSSRGLGQGTRNQ